jgi:transcription antitermination factor NusG
MDRSWLAAYTRSRHEVRVATQLKQKEISFLLPLYEKFNRWSDRIQRIHSPLFPGYVFVHAHQSERCQVLQTEGVVNIVSRGGKPCILRRDEVEILRACMARPSDIAPHPYLRTGQRVCIRYGPFAGCEGILVEKVNAARVVVTIEQIMQAFAINVHLADIEAA